MSDKNRSILIIGRGPSVLRCKKEFVDKFDDVAICNQVEFEGFEDKIGSTATHWFRNWSCTWNYLKTNKINDLKIHTVINVSERMHDVKKGGKSFDDLFPDHITCKFPNLAPYFKSEYGFDPATGIMAIEYCIREGYKTIGIIGIDMYQINDNKYYHGKKIQTEVHGHNPDVHLKYINTVIKKHPEINFLIVSDATIKKQDNVKFDLNLEN